ncbi:glycosyltransferase [Micromonospora sp. NPDC049559]|uniref:glycosyltransferase family 2 protein n=1 Tax=Micromonospora sp. NPDC049559 TaxID=3155923 RepID=UPI00343F32A0
MSTGPTGAGTPPVSVIIPCYDERRWPQLVAAVDSARRQSPAPAEVVVSVDHNDALLRRARRELTGVTVLANRFTRGASGNRNTAAFHTRTPLIAMLDDDAYAHPGWLAGLVAPFADPGVVGTGGRTLPAWEGARPAWFPDEYLWVVGASFAGGPAEPGPVRNVWALSMAVRRDVFSAVGGFRESFGKVADRNRPEDTELCLRMTAASGGGRWWFVPDAVVDHAVSEARARFGYFVARCWSEGRGKVAMARLDSHRESLGSERDYLRRTLPRAVVRGLGDALRGRGAAHAARAATVLTGIAVAGLGGMVELARPAGRPTVAAPRPGTAGPEPDPGTAAGASATGTGATADERDAPELTSGRS